MAMAVTYESTHRTQVLWKRKEADSCHLASPFVDQLMDTGSHLRVEGHFRRDRLKGMAVKCQMFS